MERRIWKFWKSKKRKTCSYAKICKKKLWNFIEELIRNKIQEREKVLKSLLKKNERDSPKGSRLSALIVVVWDMFLLVILVPRTLKNLCKLLRVTHTLMGVIPLF